MDLVRTSITVNSMNDFTCQNFQELFGQDNNQGFITTKDTGRTYKVTWDKSADIISAERNKNGVSGWTLLGEKLIRWSSFDFTNTAEKWESRLTFQKQNVALAQPLAEQMESLTQQIDAIDTNVGPRLPFIDIQKKLDAISAPLTQLLDQKKWSLVEQAQQISSALAQNLPSSSFWTQQGKTQNSINCLGEYVEQIGRIITNAKNILTNYAAAAGTMEVPPNPIIYDTVFARLTSVTTNIQIFIDHYFSTEEEISKEEIDRYFRLVRNELAIAKAFTYEQLTTHRAYNALLSPPRYADSSGADAQKQVRIEFSYEADIFTFTNILVNPESTLQQIQQAADDLRITRERWQNQIQLDEKICKAINWLNSKKEALTYNPVLAQQFRRIEKLQQLIYNNGELLSLARFNELNSQYHNILRANALHNGIGKFLDGLPGFVSFGRVSNYDDKMQSRILHLTVLKNMCYERVSLTSEALDHMERHVEAHKNVIQEWVKSEFALTKTFDPIPKHLDYPTWLVEEHRTFQQKAQQIKENQWELKYEMLRNIELLKLRGERLEKTVASSEKLAESSTEFKLAAQKLRDKFTLTGIVSHLFGLTPTKEKSKDSSSSQPPVNPGSPNLSSNENSEEQSEQESELHGSQ